MRMGTLQLKERSPFFSVGVPVEKGDSLVEYRLPTKREIQIKRVLSQIHFKKITNRH